MKMIQLAGDLQIAPISIGCWSFGGGAYWGEQSQSDVDAVVGGALEAGVNLFDTAEGYNGGDSEISLGRALKGRRQKAVIMTKVPPEFAHLPDLARHCDESLRRLDTDYIDIYALHWPLNKRAIQPGTQDPYLLEYHADAAEAFDGLQRLQKAGKIRHIAVSNFGVVQLTEVVEQTGVRPVLNEILYNLISRGIEEEVLPCCVKNDVGILAYMPFHQALLTGKYDSVDEMPANQMRTRHFHAKRGGRHGGEGFEEDTFQTVAAINALAGELGIPMSQLALSWVVQQGGVASALVGCRNTKQLQQNLAAAREPLAQTVMDRLDAITTPLLYKLGHHPDYYESTATSRIY